MAFVTAPWQLFALRALLGVFAGYGALTISMAAQSAPRDQMPHAIGMVQTGHRLGPAIGPVIGGILAPTVGLRNSFLVAAAFYAVALLLVVFTYKEPLDTSVPQQGARRLGSLLAAVAAAGFPAGPAGDLRVAECRSEFRSGAAAVCRAGRSRSQPRADRGRHPVFAGRRVGGVGFSAGAAAAQDPNRARAIIVTCTMVGALALAVIVAAPGLWFFGAAIVVAGVSIGTATTTIYSVAGGLLPADAHATGFGVMTTASLLGLAVSPVDRRHYRRVGSAHRIRRRRVPDARLERVGVARLAVRTS